VAGSEVNQYQITYSFVENCRVPQHRDVLRGISKDRTRKLKRGQSREDCGAGIDKISQLGCDPFTSQWHFEPSNLPPSFQEHVLPPSQLDSCQWTH